MRYIFNSVVHDFRYEAQCTFGTDEQVIDNIDDIFKIYKGIQTVTCSIFDFVFMMNQMSQFFISQDFFAQLQNIFNHLWFFFEELIDTLFIGCIQNGAI